MNPASARVIDSGRSVRNFLDRLSRLSASLSGGGVDVRSCGCSHDGAIRRDGRGSNRTRSRSRTIEPEVHNSCRASNNRDGHNRRRSRSYSPSCNRIASRNTRGRFAQVRSRRSSNSRLSSNNRSSDDGPSRRWHPAYSKGSPPPEQQRPLMSSALICSCHTSRSSAHLKKVYLKALVATRLKAPAPNNSMR